MMHDNLAKRFLRLLVTSSSYDMALLAFKCRYPLLWDAVLLEKQLTAEQLAEKVGFAPLKDGSNAIIRGEAEPSTLDCLKLLDVYSGVPVKE